MTRVEIRPRSAWGAKYDNGSGPAAVPWNEGWFLHHSVTRARNGPEAVRELEEIGESRFGAGISYTVCISPDGTAWQGHSFDRKGSHTKGHNTHARAFVLIGNYSVERPTTQQQETIARIMADKAEAGQAPLVLRGHRDVRGTECPGNAAYNRIPAILERARELLNRPHDAEDEMNATQEAKLDSLTRKVDRITALLEGKPLPDKPSGAAEGTLIGRIRDSLARLEGRK